MTDPAMTTDEALDVLRQAITDACTWIGIAQNESPYRERALTAMSHLAAMADPERGRDQLADTQRAVIEAAERRGYERARAEAVAVADLIEAAQVFVNDDRQHAWHHSYRPKMDAMRAALDAAIDQARGKGVQGA